MRTPHIDKRSLEDVLQQLRERIPFYTPEWRAEEGEAATAVMRIFAHMYMGILHRLNRSPDKHFIAFLNMLGVKLIPARQAKAPITIHLSAGSAEPVLVPAGTQVAAPAEDGGQPIVFETEQSILAVPAQITDIFTVDPFADAVYQAPESFGSGRQPIPYGGTLLGATPAGSNRLLLPDTNGLNKGDLLLIEDAAFSEFAEIADVQTDTVLTLNPLEAHGAGTGVRREVTYELFNGCNKQEHVLFIGDPVLFDVTNDVVFELSISGNPAFESKRSELLRRINWHYWADTEQWIPLEAETADGIRLRKKDRSGFREHSINGMLSRWIRGTIPQAAALDFQDVRIHSISVHAASNVTSPDRGFANDVPLDITGMEGLYPFGRTPRLYDSFYLASRQVFSKKGATAYLSFNLTHHNPDGLPPEAVNAELSWEYWNGGGWLKLSGTFDNLHPGERKVELQFAVPSDMTETAVLGQKGYWIRARLIGGGFGHQEWDSESSVLKNRYILPILKEPALSFGSEPAAASPVKVLSLNNLAYRDLTPLLRVNQPVALFEPLADKHRSLYLGFDKSPVKGPISLYFSLLEQEYSEDNRPSLMWEYYGVRNGTGGWAKLDIQDETRHLTQSGCLVFVGPGDLAETELFGKRSFWIRAVNTDDKYQPSARKTSEAAIRMLPGGRQQGEDTCRCAPSSCTHRIDLFESAGGHADGIVRAPKVKGIYMNTTMAVQSESVKDEVPGSGHGSPSQAFTLARMPVYEESVFVNELGALSESERQELKNGGSYEVREEKDGDGMTTAFWVKWLPVELLMHSGPTDRHYEIDRTSGTVLFGDGKHGAMLPAGADNIRVSYRTGGGVKGNVGAGAVSMLRTSIAFVDRISNPEPATGGFDTERTEQAIERGPYRIRHRNRAVTAQDYEQLALEAAQGIARIKCLPNMNDAGLPESGWVTVVIVPHSGEPQPVPSARLRHQVESFLRQRASNLLSAPRHIKVIGPAYAEISVTADIVAESFESVPTVEKEAVRRLKAYLHPLTGGPDGKGWEFGSLPCLSEFYRILETVPHADHIERLRMTIRDPRSGKSVEVTPDRETGVNPLPHILLYSGEHHLVVNTAIVT